MCGLLKLVALIVIYYFSCFLNAGQCTAYYNKMHLSQGRESLDEWRRRRPRLAVASDEQPGLCGKMNIYMCEEPPYGILPSLDKTCSYRGIHYQQQVFRWVAGRGCLLYTPDFLYIGGSNPLNLNAGCFYGNWFAPCLEIMKADGTCGCFPFDPAMAEVAEAVRATLVPRAHGRWERCFYEADHCCSHVVSRNHTDPSQCEATFDGWTCWGPAEAGSTASELCPEFAYSDVGPECDHYSSKQCLLTGSWDTDTDYSTCSIVPRLLSRQRYHVAILCLSIVLYLPALIIFCVYKKFREKFAMYRNLLVCIVVRDVLVAISRNEIFIDELTNPGESVMFSHSLLCRLLTLAERVATIAVFVASLLHAAHLYGTLFNERYGLPSWWTKVVHCLLAFGALVATIPVGVWASAAAAQDDRACWLLQDGVQWTLLAPLIGLLLLHAALLGGALQMWLRAARNYDRSVACSVKVGLAQLLLLTTQLALAAAFTANTADCVGEQARSLARFCAEAAQGAMVAVLVCYLDTEVHAMLKTTYKKAKLALTTRKDHESNHRGSLAQNYDRRLAITPSHPSSNTVTKYQKSPQTKLHVAEIISIQASDRFAEILEPVYETIENGFTHTGYDYLERPDNDGFLPNIESIAGNYYGFAHASSVSIQCQEWLRCVSSPGNSIYNRSLNDYDTAYFERKSLPHSKFEDPFQEKSVGEVDKVTEAINNEVIKTAKPIQVVESDWEDCETMLEEIMQFIKTTERLDPTDLSLSGKDSDEIVIVNE